jgi:hypothetical protein
MKKRSILESVQRHRNFAVLAKNLGKFGNLGARDQTRRWVDRVAEKGV